MNKRSLDEQYERDRTLGRQVWAAYLTGAAFLTATRVALLVWLNRPSHSQTSAQIDHYLGHLLPEVVLVLVWHPEGKAYFYLIWGSLITLGSFVLATPILFVGWLRRRHLIVQIALCGLTNVAVSLLLYVIVSVVGLNRW
jgi:hypothetical protein